KQLMFGINRRRLEAALWFLAAPVVFFREAAFGGAFFHHEAWMHSFATRAWWFEQLKNGHFALWSSGMFAGYPLFAESQTAPLYPTTFALFTLLPPTLAFAWDVILHFAWAGFGLYRLARLLGTRHTSALFAGTMYAYSAFLVTHLSDFNLLAGAAWMPWIVWGTLGALRGRKAHAVVLAIGWTLLSLAPHPNGTIFAAIAMLFTLVTAALGGGYGLRGYLRALYATGAGLLAGAIQTVATFSLLRETERSAGTNEAFRSLGSLPPWNLLHGALPNLQGTPRLDTWYGGLDWTLYAETCFYFGVSAIPCVCVGLFFLRGRVPLALATGAALSFAIMIGRYGLAWEAVSALPLLDATRIPGRFALPFLLCIAILAGRGIDATVRRRSRRALAVAGAITIALVLLAIGAQANWGTPGEALRAASSEGSALANDWEARLARWENEQTLDRLHAIVFACAGIGILALFTYIRYAVPLRYAPIAILSLDLILWGRSWNPVIDPALLADSPPAIEALEPLDHAPRFARRDIDEIRSLRPARDRVDPLTPGWDVRDHAREKSKPGPRNENEYATAAWSLSPNVTLLYGAESAEGFTPLIPAAWREWVGLPAAIPGVPMPAYTGRMIDLLGVDAVLSSRTGAPLPGGLFLARNRNPMPRARLSVRWRSEQNRANLLGALHAGDHDPRAITFVDRAPALPGAPSFQGPPFAGATDRALPLTIPGPNKRLVEVDRSGLVVLAETYDPGWRVTDPAGETVDALQADGLFLAFPAGAPGTYEAQYRPAWFHRGLMLSGAGLLLLVLRFVLPARPPRPPKHEPAAFKDAALIGAAPHPPRFESASLAPVGVALLLLLASGGVVKQRDWAEAWRARTIDHAAAASWSENGLASLRAGAHAPALQALE
ncbi:MAG: hypothetical protein HKN20_04540, partial [Gemmatimonadetes bacterium]|nr:hypothetical protein [Gemmatimonadota bacterium]